MLTAYIEANLANRLIQCSSSPVAVLILFAKKKYGELMCCVYYGAFILETVKNQYPCPLIPEVLDHMSEIRIFMKLDLHGAYNLIQIKEGKIWNTAFGTRYSQFESHVMPFGLTHALAVFQSHIDDCLQPYIEDFAVCYLDIILTYLTNEKAQEEHVHQVLQRHKEFGLHC